MIEPEGEMIWHFCPAVAVSVLVSSVVGAARRSPLPTTAPVTTQADEMQADEMQETNGSIKSIVIEPIPVARPSHATGP